MEKGAAEGTILQVETHTLSMLQVQGPCPMFIGKGQGAPYPIWQRTLFQTMERPR